jgi:biopolymer transport protein ExbB
METLDLDSLLTEDEPTPESAIDKEMEPGDNKSFRVTTDDDITSFEVGDIYKSAGAVFKVVAINSKGSDGGTFTVERIGGRSDPAQNWTRTSGLGPLSILSRQTLWDIYAASGNIMHGIALCLLAVIVIALNSAWIYRAGRQSSHRFVEPARSFLEKEDIEGFRNLAMQETGLFGHVCRAMAVRFDISTLEDIRIRCQIEAVNQIRALRAPLRALSLIAAVAPLLGLLGTVIGMVVCFESVAYEAASAAKSQTLATGIRTALFTTAGGLSVAIPALLVLYISNLRLNKVISRCESLTEQFIHGIAVIKRRSGTEKPASTSDETRKEPEPATA